MKKRIELFHRLTDPACAEVRRYLLAHGLAAVTEFRNIENGEEARADLLARTGDLQVPTVYLDGVRLVGAESVLSALKEIS